MKSLTHISNIYKTHYDALVDNMRVLVKKGCPICKGRFKWKVDHSDHPYWEGRGWINLKFTHLGQQEIVDCTKSALFITFNHKFDINWTLLTKKVHEALVMTHVRIGTLEEAAQDLRALKI